MLFAVGDDLLLERIDAFAVVVADVDGFVVFVVFVVVVVDGVVEEDGFVIVHYLWWIC